MKKSGYQKQKAERKEKGEQLVNQFIQKRFLIIHLPLVHINTELPSES